MSVEFKNVVEFNEKIINLLPVEYLSPERLEWFKTTINEELEEFTKANTEYIAAKTANADRDTLIEHHVDMVDAIIDLIYFALGRLYEIGVSVSDFDCMWELVHTANMTKKRGNKGRGSDDDAIKPTGWQGPEESFIKILKARTHAESLYTSNTIEDHNDIIKQLDTREQTQTAKINIAELSDLSLQNTSKNNINENLTVTSNGVFINESYFNEDARKTTTETAQQLHLPGMKYDGDKPNLSLVFGGFPHALLDVGQVGTFGARKYTPEGWKSVENLQDRYMAALLRHVFAILCHNQYDAETGRNHLAHVAWNALAMLEDWLKDMDYDHYDKMCLAISKTTLRKHFEKN